MTRCRRSTGSIRTACTTSGAIASAAGTGTVTPLGVPGGGSVSGGTTSAGGSEAASGEAKPAASNNMTAYAILGGALVVALGLGGGAFMLMRRR
jgi:cobalamin biosynthesis Mg chelatase CobN